jgi:hypothetical protein
MGYRLSLPDTAFWSLFSPEYFPPNSPFSAIEFGGFTRKLATFLSFEKTSLSFEKTSRSTNKLKARASHKNSHRDS